MSKVSTTIPESLGKSISDICPFSLGENHSQNHCAHYVSHMMGYEFSGPTCKNFTWADKQKEGKGATIRVDDLFNRCTEVGLLADKSQGMTECLIFVTLDTNVRKSGSKYTMRSHPRKHIGILYQNKVWNYSNSGRKVVADTVTHFESKFSSAYKTAGSTVTFYYGKLL